MHRFTVYNNKTPLPAMGHSNPVGDVLGFFFCLYLCDRLWWEPRPRYVYATQPVVVAQPGVVTQPVVARPVVLARGAYAKAPEPAPLPALALEVPPKAEVVERV